MKKRRDIPPPENKDIILKGLFCIFAARNVGRDGRRMQQQVQL
jgi:hypothetical protein